MTNLMPGQLSPNIDNCNGGGRPKGSKNKATLIKECLHGKMVNIVEKDLDAILVAVVEKAKDGSLMAARIILENSNRIIEAEQEKGGPSIQIMINRAGVVLKSGDNTLTVEQ